MRHLFHPEAASEFEEAVRFYKVRGRKLGPRLRREIRRTISLILRTPERWRMMDSEVRRCFVNVFPYSVLFTIEPDYILIIAIAHHRRAPGYWKQRLTTKPKV